MGECQSISYGSLIQVDCEYVVCNLCVRIDCLVYIKCWDSRIR